MFFGNIITAIKFFIIRHFLSLLKVIMYKCSCSVDNYIYMVYKIPTKNKTWNLIFFADIENKSMKFITKEAQIIGFL